MKELFNMMKDFIADIDKIKSNFERVKVDEKALIKINNQTVIEDDQLLSSLISIISNRKGLFSSDKQRDFFLGKMKRGNKPNKEQSDLISNDTDWGIVLGKKKDKPDYQSQEAIIIDSAGARKRLLLWTQFDNKSFDDIARSRGYIVDDERLYHKDDMSLVKDSRIVRDIQEQTRKLVRSGVRVLWQR